MLDVKIDRADEEQLSEKTHNIHRAIISLIEELEAIDWYTQRAEACSDSHLQAVLKQNRDEEIEHASMTLEWIRRNFPKFNDALKTYLFTSDITAIEKEAERGEKEGEKTRVRRRPTDDLQLVS